MWFTPCSYPWSLILSIIYFSIVYIEIFSSRFLLRFGYCCVLLAFVLLHYQVNPTASFVFYIKYSRIRTISVMLLLLLLRIFIFIFSILFQKDLFFVVAVVNIRLLVNFSVRFRFVVMVYDIARTRWWNSRQTDEI